MAANENVEVRLRLRNARQFTGDANRASRSVRGIGNEADRASRRSRIASAAMRGLGRSMLFMGRMAIYGAGAAGALTVAFGVKAVKAAADLGEEVNKANVIFEDGANSILRWSEHSATALGLSQADALQAASNFGGLFQNVGIATDKAVEMSKATTQLGADLASAFNMEPAEAVAALRSGLAGESEPLKRFNIFINEASVRQEALRLGLVKGNKELSQNAKTLARYSLIQKQTNKIQGDFKNTSDSLPNAMRTLRAQIDDTAAAFGVGLTPTVEKAAVYIRDTVMPVFKDLGETVADIMAKDISFQAKMTEIKLATGTAIRPFVDKIRAFFQHPEVQQAMSDAAAWMVRTLATAIANGSWAIVKAFVNAGPTGWALAGTMIGTKVMGAMTLVAIRRQGRLAKLMAEGLGEVGETGGSRAARRFANHPRWSRIGRTIARSIGPITIAAAVVISARQAQREMEAKLWGEENRGIAERIIGNTTKLGWEFLKDAGNSLGFGIRRQHGGIVPGIGRGDIVPAMLEPGEFVVRRDVVDRLGPSFFASLNRNAVRPIDRSALPASGEIVLHNVTQLDGRVVAESVARHTSNRKARK